MYDNNFEFEQVVEGDGPFNDGDISVESSDATGIALTAATGYEFRFGENESASASVQGGFTAMLSFLTVILSVLIIHLSLLR
jgi:hypothetical protein